MQVIENSQWFDSLEMILEYVMQSGCDDYLKIGLENTIKMGYYLTNHRWTCWQLEKNPINQKGCD